MSASGNNGSRDAGTGNDGSQAAIPASAIAASRFPATGSLRIALVAGETSGDLLGAGLIAELRRRFPDAEFAGIGGDAMRGVGCQTWFDASELALMGLAEILRHLPRLLKLRRAFRERVLDWRPDVFIGIDAPDFNLGVERWLKQRGIRTVHYVSPSVWAWREKRAEKIGASADMVLCLFPMEPPIYARHGVDARFVGHPMADAIPLDSDRADARTRLALPATAPVLAVLPGSRLGEIGRLGPAFFEAAWQVAERMPDLHIKVPQLGGVRIGDDCEIGANTCVDRGALEDTVLEEDVRLDNLVQIAHNCHIGAHSAIAGCTGIAGSARIGRYCLLGGAVGVVGHLEICDHVVVTGKSVVRNSITEPGEYSSGTPLTDNRTWRKNAARFKQLDSLARRVLAVSKEKE